MTLYDGCSWCHTRCAKRAARWPLCDECAEDRTKHCVKFAADVWSNIRWDGQIDQVGQYIDTRFLFEALEVPFQRLTHTLRRQWLGRDEALDPAVLSVEEARRIVLLYAPRRRPWGQNAEEIFDSNLTGLADYFVDRVLGYYAEIAEELLHPTTHTSRAYAGKDPLDDAESMAERDMEEEWLPSGAIFLECLKLGYIVRAPPWQVFRHVVLGEGVVPEPWRLPKQQRPGNSGPYLGRIPPARWKHLGVRQSLRNLIRTWCCFCLEKLGLTAREAMRLCDMQAFHYHAFAFEEDDAGPTTAYESNYARDKRWLRRRLDLVKRPFADMPEVERRMAPMGFDASGYDPTRLEYRDTLVRILEVGYVPDM